MLLEMKQGVYLMYGDNDSVDRWAKMQQGPL